MQKYNTTEFLEEILESCNNITSCWKDNRALDFGEIKRIKSEVENLLLSERKDILSFYEYAKHQGAYRMVYCRDLLQVLCDYELYHDDMLGFIKTMIGSGTSVHGQVNAMEYIGRACKADENFREMQLFKEPDRMLFKEALGTLDAARAFCIFLDKVIDCFIELSNESIEIPRVKALLEMYQFSVLGFIREFTKEVSTTISWMIEIVNGKIPEKKESSTYVLI